MVARKEFLEKLKSLRETQLIKVVTGVRRCGKSVLLQQFHQHLLQTGTEPRQITMMNFDDLAHREIATYLDLHDYICRRLISGKMNYIILDEIQKIPDFQKAVESLFLRPNVDIYLTGSSAQLLSGELATLLSGRYIEIKMLPLSFGEYIELRGERNGRGESEPPQTRDALFADYVRFGGFPYTLELGKNEQNIRDYLESVYNTVLVKDIVSRYAISDVPNLERISQFLFSNTGNLCSAKKIADTLTSGGYKITSHTAGVYLDALHSGYIVYEAPRYDVKGKEHLRSLAKQYVVDTGLRNSKAGFSVRDYGSLLENIVYLELVRRGKNVFVGKSDANEIDFVTIAENEVEYYQVAASVLDGAVYEREYAPLKKLRDNYPKLVLTMDNLGSPIDEGIAQMNIMDWLLRGV